MSPIAFTARRAFTLVELLAVVAIFGILAAIIIPVTTKVRENARKSQCSSNIRQIATSMLLYAAENKNHFPAVRESKNGAQYIWSYNLTRSNLLPERFTGWYCPTHALNDPAVEARTKQWWTTEYARSYATCSPLFVGDGRAQRNLLSIPQPSHTLMLTEWHNSDGALNSYTCSTTGRGLLSDSALKVSSSKHADGGRNYAFVDGHVAFLSLAEANKAELWME